MGVSFLSEQVRDTLYPGREFWGGDGGRACVCVVGVCGGGQNAKEVFTYSVESK